QSVLKYSEVSTDEQISDQPAVKLTSVRFEDKNGLQKLDVKGNIKKFKPGDNSFQFSYALLDLEATDHARYQSRLYPFDKNWSKQDSTTEWTFTKLKPDHYTFQVRAIDSNGHLSESEPFEFIIEQYWYLSRLAIVLQIILAIIIFASLVYLIVKWRLKSVIDEKRRLAVMVEERTAELQQANARLKQLANVDQLTGVANRRMLDRYLDRVWKTCIEKEQPLSLLMFDLDHFKKYNDTKGHQAGDNALIAVGKILLKLFDQKNELPSRFGGEEFVVVLPECDLDQAIKKAEQTRLFIEQSDVGITASIGVLSAVPKKEIKIQKWFKKVDEALYLAKEEGRNRVVIGELNDF
ncbi:MAG: diguanylate cyclase, partial [bacterium]